MLRFDKKQKWITLDVETEGLQLWQSRPWQVSWVIGQGDEILETYDFYPYWSDLKISDGARRVTGFNDEFYKKHGKDPLKVYEILKRYLFNPDYKIVGHNFLGYDTYIIGVWQERLFGKKDYSFVPRIYDSHLFAKAIKLELPIEEGEDLITFQYRVSSVRKRGLKTNLGAMAKEYNIPVDPDKQHDALYDVELNYKVWRKMLWDLEI